MARRRSNGEGSWGKKNIKGILYYYYKDPNGKYTYGRTQKEVKDKLKDNSFENLLINKNTTFGKYITDWLKLKRNVIEKSTYEGYSIIIKTMILQYKDYDLNNKTLNNLSPRIFQAYLDSLANNYSRGSIIKIWHLIQQCVKYGENQKEIPKNPLFMVKIPPESKVVTKKKEIPFLNEEELDSLYNLLENYVDVRNNHRYRNSNNAHAIILIAYTGVRVGELIALKWQNVNLEERYINISESSATIKDENGKNTIIDKTTKTESGIRKIPLPSRAIEMIEYFHSQNPNHKPSDYVCVTSNNNQLNRRNINRTFDSMCKACNLPHMGVHALRHSYGSILLQKGINIKTISNLLGHKNISTTYDIYIGVDEDSKAKAIENAFG